MSDANQPLSDRNPSEKASGSAARSPHEQSNEVARVQREKYFLASIVETSQDSIISIDFDGTITSWNKSAEGLYGYPIAEAIGQPLTMLTLPEDLREVLRNIDSVKHSRKVAFRSFPLTMPLTVS